MNVPQHVAIILDGNGRWAKSKGMPRNYGHAQGSKNVERICEDAYKMGIKYLTVYAFSTENWSRPKGEVDALMTLLRNYMKTCLNTAKKNRMKVRVIGDKTGLDPDIQTRIRICSSAPAGSCGCSAMCMRTITSLTPCSGLPKTASPAAWATTASVRASIAAAGRR